MRLLAVLAIGVALLAQSGCAVLAGDFPARANKAPAQVVSDLIRLHQRRLVRESWGEWEGQCLTDVDYAGFVRSKVAAKLAERLARAGEFREIAASLRALPENERTKLLNNARNIARPTWAMMGVIDRRGQTEAGHSADLDIAAAIAGALEAAVSTR